MRKTTILSLCLPLLVLVSSQPAHACSCAPLPEPQQAAEGADAVFSGTVLEVTSSGLQNQVRIRVDEVWKGVKCGEVTITTPVDSAACGLCLRGRRELSHLRHEGEGQAEHQPLYPHPAAQRGWRGPDGPRPYKGGLRGEVILSIRGV